MLRLISATYGQNASVRIVTGYFVSPQEYLYDIRATYETHFQHRVRD
jgi:hypothetical protein